MSVSNRLPRYFVVSILVIVIFGAVTLIFGAAAMVVFQNYLLFLQVFFVGALIFAFLKYGVYDEIRKGNYAGLYFLLGWVAMLVITSILIGYIDIPISLFFTVVYAIGGYFFWLMLEPMLDSRAVSRGVKKFDAMVFAVKPNGIHVVADPQIVFKELSESGWLVERWQVIWENEGNIFIVPVAEKSWRPFWALKDYIDFGEREYEAKELWDYREFVRIGLN